MLSDLMWVFILAIFAVYGLTRPYIALCGVVWVDTLMPQDISYDFLVGKPISFIMALLFIISFVVNIRKNSFPRKVYPLFILVVFLSWITLTTYYAEFQQQAWFKHNIAYKTILVALFFPFVLNSRLKLEALILTIVISVAYYTSIGGVRTLLGQAGYGTYLVLTRALNSGIAETSTMSMVSIMVLPLIFYLLKVSMLQETSKLFKPILLVIAALSLVTCIGTYARTGLIALAVLIFIVFIKAINKFMPIVIIGLSVILLLAFTPQDWKDRMGTIEKSEQDASAFGRIVVWRWTIDYAKEHPWLGGGFDAYLANAGQLNRYVSDDVTMTFNRAKAFHSIYFEVLGEHGYIGLALFIIILFSSFRLNRQIVKEMSADEWLRSMAKTVNAVLVIYCICGNFIAVAFSPWPYYLLGLSVSFHNCYCKQNKFPNV